ncbi:MAG: hypothetical protein HOW97_32475 [Catenulispora sp.]|nr:hypothetical protein [Catenulispora sp.]
MSTLDRQAKAALAAWEPVLSARDGRPFLLKGDPSQVVDADAGMDARFKVDWLAGRVTAKQPLSAAVPPAATLVWPGGGTAAVPLISAADALYGLQQQIAEPCSSCADPPLSVSGVVLGTVDRMSSRGSVQVPAWIFSFAGYSTELAYLAIAPTAPVNAPDAPKAVNGGIASEKVAVSADQRVLTVAFDGACGSDVSGHAFEAVHAVAIVIVEVPHPGQDACQVSPRQHAVTIGLATPLAGRTVLGPAGMPLPIG